jgi:NAD(P)-dependent dehydrogenase (short-subunit alcohol dehydrogenase family)
MQMQELRFDNKVVLITGAGRGLGRAYALLLARLGAHVVVNNRIRRGLEHQRPVAEDVVDEIRAAGGRAVASTEDISTSRGARAAVQTALDEFGSLDVLVNNAGVAHTYTFADYPEDEFASMLDIHVHGTWHVSQAAWSALARSGGGRMINTVSRAAYVGDPQNAAYAAAKGAIHGLTRALAVEGRPRGILVNAICPAAWTPLYDRAATDIPEERRRQLRSDFKTEYVAPVVIALAHESCPCTGEVITAIGGHVNRYFVSQTTGITVGDGFTAQEFLDRLPDVWDQEGSLTMGLALPGGRGGPTPAAEVPPAARRAAADRAVDDDECARPDA